MEEIPLIRDVVIIFGLAFAVMLVCLKARLPGLIGLLITGVISGPHGLGLVNAREEVETLAELGIALLLFGVGLELSLKRFVQTFKLVSIGGGLQVLLTGIAGLATASVVGRPGNEAIYFGCLLSLSSTAIVLRLLQERHELSSPHGQLSLSILIFQDLIVVPMMLIVPVLAGEHIEASSSLAMAVLFSTLILGAVLGGAYWVVPRMLETVARTRSDQLFLLTVLFLGSGVAWVTSQLGLSLALGAFLAGLIISESEYHHHVLGHVFPFREVFTSFFFVSTGMLLDIGFVIDYWWLIALCMAGVCLLKAVIVGGVVIAMGYPLRSAVLTGLAICQLGEFSFLLIREGMQHGIADPWLFKLFLATTLFTMSLSPFIIRNASRISDWLHSFSWPGRIVLGIRKNSSTAEAELSRHVIIAGFGTAGRNLAYCLKIVGIPYIVIELNPNRVSEFRAKGEPIVFGDASHANVLEHAHIHSATGIAVLINDSAATNRVVAQAQRLNAAIYTVARTRTVEEMDPLIHMGADEVVPEEFEASVEVFTRVLRKYLVPREEIESLSAELRADRYQILRLPDSERPKLSDLKLHLSSMEVETFRLHPGARLSGKTLLDSQLRAEYQVTVLLVQRDGEYIWHLTPDLEFKAGDIVVLFGSPDQLAAVAELFQ